MTVLHLGRKTKFPRASMVSANTLCSRFPEDTSTHQKIWSIVASRPTTPLNLATLETALLALA